jgi:hypothetical protein
MNKSNKQKTGKSGYEIRWEVLNKALEMADGRYHFSQEALRYEAEKTNKGALPIAPDNRVEEAMQIGEKLYRFVESK